MAEASFDLLTEPWIAVRAPDGIREVSLMAAFERAHEYAALAGEVPTQDVAILRMMLAILHRAVEPVQGYPHERWRRIWAADRLPMDLVESYLETWRHRFDLFDDEAPFMQVAGLTAAKTSGLVKLIADVPDGKPFFTTRAGTAINALSFAEAARWLVHCHAYDVSGIKTGANGDDRVKGGKGYPIGTGWSGQCGLVVVESDTLRDALALNLVLEPRDADADPDLPIWERAPLTAAVEAGHASPRGQADVMTWPSRRILLHHDGSKVTDALISNGDPLSPQNRHTVEPMTAFRRSANQQKVSRAEVVYMPHRHDPTRSVWRGLSGLLTERASGGAVSSEAAERLPPRNLAWLEEMRGDLVLDPDLPVRLRAIGMSYGTQNSSIETTYDDALAMRVAVATDATLRSLAISAASAADDAVTQIANLAANIARAAGRPPEGPRDNAREDAFSRLDAPYRRWLSELDTRTDPGAARAKWQGIARRIVMLVAADVIASGGDAAWKGRHCQGRYVDSALAEAWFFLGLKKSLPAVGPGPDSKEES